MTGTERPILVLLPVYNGAAYLREQIDSILHQTHPSVVLLCRDDGSHDDSPALLEHYARQWPQRIEVMCDSLGNLGDKGSFAHLMGLAQAHPLMQGNTPAFLAFSDQDDVWLPGKLARCAHELAVLDNAAPQTPALVHSDLALVSDDGSPMAPSMARYQGLQTRRTSLAAQLLSNTVTGCTVLMNRAMLSACLPIPTQAIMHDWWVSLVASAWGQRTYIDEPLIQYRQHQGNTIGAKPLEGLPLKRWRVLRWFDNRHATIFRLNAQQARAFLQRHRARLSWRQTLVLWAACGLAIPVPPLQRIIYRTLHKV